MGRQILKKKAKVEAREAVFTSVLAKHSKQNYPKPISYNFERFLLSEDHYRNPHTFYFKGKSKDPEKQFLQFIKFVYEKFPTSRLFDQYWLKYYKISDHASRITIQRLEEYLNWYILIASGQSLYKKVTHSFLTKKETHNFLNAGDQFSVDQAIFFSIAVCAGADSNTASMIARSKLSNKDYRVEFWRNCARFFAANKPTNSLQLNDIIDYLQHRFIENPRFSLFGMGYTFDSLSKHTHKWHADLARIKVLGDSKWEGHPLHDEVYKTEIDRETKYWHFTQIKNAKELAAEGNAMRHCVYSYRDQCVRGDISIWSISISDTDEEKGRRKVTIELRNNGKIAQMRGIANRPTTKDERNIIGKWARANNLYFGEYT